MVVVRAKQCEKTALDTLRVHLIFGGWSLLQLAWMPTMANTTCI